MKDQTQPTSIAESEILIGRMIDGEASPTDRARFESLAENDPVLWRRLALRQQDMAALSARVQQELQIAERVDLPLAVVESDDRSEVVAAIGGNRWTGRAMAASWAAAIALVVVAAWSGHWLGLRQGALTAARPATHSNDAKLTSDQHLQEYLKAPFVVDQLPPTMLQVEELPDGRQAMRILRRIEEVVLLPPDAKLPIDNDGTLTKPPSELRHNSEREPTPN